MLTLAIQVYAGKWHEIRVGIKTFYDKCVDENTWRDVENEISLLRTVRHPNIVLFFGAGSFSSGK